MKLLQRRSPRFDKISLHLTVCRFPSCLEVGTVGLGVHQEWRCGKKQPTTNHSTELIDLLINGFLLVPVHCVARELPLLQNYEMHLYSQPAASSSPPSLAHNRWLRRSSPLPAARLLLGSSKHPLCYPTSINPGFPTYFLYAGTVYTNKARTLSVRAHRRVCSFSPRLI